MRFEAHHSNLGLSVAAITCLQFDKKQISMPKEAARRYNNLTI
jgi:hypothetical protein